MNPFQEIIRRDPENWPTRLVYADYLEENGQAAEAYLQRLAAECHEVPENYAVLHVQMERPIGVALLQNVEFRPDRSPLDEMRLSSISWFEEPASYTAHCEAMIYNVPEVARMIKTEAVAEIGILGSVLAKDWLIVDPLHATPPRRQHGFSGVIGDFKQDMRPWRFCPLQIYVLPQFDGERVVTFTMSIVEE